METGLLACLYDAPQMPDLQSFIHMVMLLISDKCRVFTWAWAVESIVTYLAMTILGMARGKKFVRNYTLLTRTGKFCYII